MAVAIEMTFTMDHGDPHALYDQANEEMHTHREPPQGLILHWAAVNGPHSLRIVDVWESTAHFEQFAKERLGPTSAKLGIPKPETTTHEIYGLIQGAATFTAP